MTMRCFLLAVLALATATIACNPVKRCKTDRDCPSGSTCSQLFCVAMESTFDAGGGAGGGGEGGGGAGGGSDAGVPDAGVPDAGVPDAGVPDAGVPDAGECAPLAPGGVALMGLREAHTAVLLPGCRVLVTAGLAGTSGERNDAWIYDGRRGGWFDAGFLAESRANHASVALADGTAWVVGGQFAGVGSRDSTERFDGGAWSAGPTLTIPRTRHTVTAVPDAGVFAIGGYDTVGGIAEIEHCAPDTDKWVVIGDLTEGRNRHTSTRLLNNQILIVGGTNTVIPGDSPRVEHVEILDTNTLKIHDGGFLTQGRSQHTALAVENAVLILGGYLADGGATEAVELFNTATATWRCLPPMQIGRGEFSAALIDESTVLIAGGRDSQGGTALESAELYRIGIPFRCGTKVELPDSSDAGTMNGKRARLTLTRLPNGTVLAVGSSDAGQPASELYVPGTGWRSIP